MVGGALKVSPVLASLPTADKTYTSYFPKGKWVSLRDFTVIDNSAQGANVNLTAANTV